MCLRLFREHVTYKRRRRRRRRPCHYRACTNARHSLHITFVHTSSRQAFKSFHPSSSANTVVVLASIRNAEGSKMSLTMNTHASSVGMLSRAERSFDIAVIVKKGCMLRVPTISPICVTTMTAFRSQQWKMAENKPFALTVSIVFEKTIEYNTSFYLDFMFHEFAWIAQKLFFICGLLANTKIFQISGRLILRHLHQTFLPNTFIMRKGLFREHLFIRWK
jgi:hypothetical protein